MKPQTVITQISLISLMAVLGIGCAKRGGSFQADSVPAVPAPVSVVNVISPVNGVIPGAPTASDASRGGDWSEGATSALIQESKATLDYFVYTHPINNPSDLRISVKTSNWGVNRWGGTVQVSFYDNNRFETRKFTTEYQGQRRVTTPDGSWPISAGFENMSYAQYNNWFLYGPTGNKKRVFHGYFQDSTTAVMLIVDGKNCVDLGDGGGCDSGSTVSGEVWFKNFKTSPYPQGYIPCWFIVNGPYDCRTFLTSSNTMSPLSFLYPPQSTYPVGVRDNNPNIPSEPERGWRRLGKFDALNLYKAFPGLDD